MKKVNLSYVIVILLTCLMGWSSQQVVLAEEADVNSHAGIEFETSYEGDAGESPELPGTDNPQLVTPPELPATKSPGVSKVLPQTGVVAPDNLSWIGLIIIGMVALRLRQKK